MPTPEPEPPKPSQKPEPALEPATEANCYDLLGVSDGCSDDELKKAWRRAVLKNHPDRGGSHFGLIWVNAAYKLCLKERELAATELYDWPDLW